MKTKLPKYSGPAGEYLVLGELLRRGYESYRAQGETQKGWDIVCLSDRDRNIRVQVKTIDWPSQLAVNGNFDSGFDILVIVLLNLSGYPRYLIIPQNEIDSICSGFNEDRKNNQRTITISKKFEKHTEKDLSKYENRWDIISEMFEI